MRQKLASLLALLIAAPASATQWTVLGARATGMGGAGVAVSQGPVSSYWNPASNADPAAAQFGFQSPVSVGWEVSGQMLEGANDLNKIAEACRASGGAQTGDCSQAGINLAIDKLNDVASGIRGDVAASFQAKVKRVTVFYNYFINAGVRARMESANLDTNQVQNDQTGKIIARGLMMHEFGVGYGFPVGHETGLTLGGNLKAIAGLAGYDEIRISGEDPGRDGSFRDLKDNARHGVQPGVDLGAQWDVTPVFPDIPARPRLALSARNVNRPAFKNPVAATRAGQAVHVYLDPQVRMGLGFTPLNWINVAADVDLTRNLTPLEGVASQEVAAGVEVNVVNGERFNLPLRAGVARNIAYSGSKTMLAAGFGLHLVGFQLDVSTRLSPSRISTQSIGGSQSLPAGGIIAVQLGAQFGKPGA